MDEELDSSPTAGTPSHQTASTYVLIAGLLVAVALIATGCRSKECARMLTCCQAVKDVDGVGDACGPRATGVDDPKTCQTIIETIGYMYEEKGKELPAECKFED